MAGGRGRKRGRRRRSENGCVCVYVCAVYPCSSHGTHGLHKTMPFSMLGSSTKFYSWKNWGAEWHAALGPSEVFTCSTLLIIYKVAKQCARCRGHGAKSGSVAQRAQCTLTQTHGHIAALESGSEIRDAYSAPVPSARKEPVQALNYKWPSSLKVSL